MKSGKAIGRIFIAFVCLALMASAAWAQVSTSSITGTVTDKSGAVIAGANVMAKNEATGLNYETTTTSAGSFTLSSLVPGQYTITVSHPGFRTFASAHNALTVGAPLVVDVTLDVGQVTQVVQVESSYERVSTSDAMISDVVGRHAISDLPLNGRNPLSLITLQPGLIQRSSGNRGSGTHVNGSRDRSFNVTLDGIDINEPSVPNPQNNVFRLTPDNVQEYRVVTSNPTAEYGRNSGANIAMATRSGTNQIHGSAFESFRNDVLNANDWFNNLRHIAKPVFHLNSFGADAGGPIFKNKTFWFASWQTTRLNFSQPIATAFGTPSLYTALARKGIFRYVVGTVNGFTKNDRSLVDAQGNLKPGIPTCSATVTTNCIATYDAVANDPAKIGLDSVMSAFFNADPLPNDFSTVGDGLNTAGFSWNPPAVYPDFRFLGRIDHQFNSNNSLFVRYTFTRGDSTKGDLLNSRPSVFPGFPPLGNVTRRPQNLAVSYRRVFSPQLVNELTAGYSRFLFDFAFGRANPKFPDIPPWSPANVTTPYINQSGTARWLTTDQIIDNVSYSRGAHMFRAGINFRLIQHNDERSFVGGVINAPRVAFSGSRRVPLPTSTSNPFKIPSTSSSSPLFISTSDRTRLRNMISDWLGLPGSLTQAFFSNSLDAYVPSGLYIRGARLHQYNWYVQDEWKVGRNLTLNLGVRYELNRPGTEGKGLILRPDKPLTSAPGATFTFVQKETFWDRDNAVAFLPRVGLAWQPFAGGKTVVRAGYSMAYDTVSTFQLVPILGLVPGSSAACTFTMTTTSSGGVTISPSAASCPQPANLDKRVAQNFPLFLAQPSAPPSSFTSPTPQSSAAAPPAGAIDPNLQNPTVHEWTFNIQRDLGKNVILQVGYVGKRGTHLFRAYNLNQLRINHDGYIQSFIRARDNFLNCGKPDAPPPCGQPVGLLQSILGSNITSADVTDRLKANAAGSLAAFIDGDGISGLFNSMVTVTGRKDFFRPYPQFGTLFYFDSGGDSFYHSLQIHLRRQERNLSFGLAYTFGKSIDNMSTDPVGATSSGNIGNNSGTPTDIYNFNVDRSRSDFDRTHTVTGYFLWDLPFGRGQRWGNNWPGFLNHILGGWSGSSMFTWMTGEPFSVLSGQFTNSNVRNSRADLIVSPPPATGLFDVSVITGPTVFPASVLPLTNPTGTPFRIPPPGSNGNQARNMFDGPNSWNVDFGIAKRFRITERWNLMFRAELFNAFNHPNFDNPLGSSDGVTNAFNSNSTDASPDFGRVCCNMLTLPSQANVIPVGDAPRVIQFTLKLSF